jgi:nitrogenase molybdenum-cofactor synthesis protein NifE
MSVVATGTRKSTEDDKARIRSLMGDEAVMIEDGNPRNLLDLYRREGADLMVAGGRNQYTALKARIPFLDINQEREFGYAGYDGMLELARQMCLTIESPIWAAVRSAPPWRPVSDQLATAASAETALTATEPQPAGASAEAVVAGGARSSTASPALAQTQTATEVTHG